jgi:hypothetical protein
MVGDDQQATAGSDGTRRRGQSRRSLVCAGLHIGEQHQVETFRRPLVVS